MLAIGVGVPSFELLVEGEDRAQRVEDVLASFPSRPALAERGGHLENAGDDPPSSSGGSKAMVKSTDAAMGRM